MKCLFPVRIFTILFIIVSSATLTTCRKDDLSREEKLARQEQKIMTECSDFIPAQIITMLESNLNALKDGEDYASYLDSLERYVYELKSAIENSFSSDEYKGRLEDTFSEMLSKGSIKCSGLGYAKGIKIDASLAGETGAGIIAALQASGGGGVKTIYDFVNLDRQVYYYTFCSDGYTFENETASVLRSGSGFTGINEVITGIKFLDNSLMESKFEGSGRFGSYALSADLAEFFRIGIPTGVGTSIMAISDFGGIRNMESCPQGMIAVENGIKVYSFSIPGSLPAGSATELAMAFTSSNLGSYTTGMPETYEKFNDDRTLAGFRMAKELLLESPLAGFLCSLQNTDLTASSVALIHGLAEITDCPSRIPSIGTRPVNTFSNTSAECGGIIMDDGGNWVRVRGVIWSTNENPDWENKLGFTANGQGTGQYASTIFGLLPNTTYYIRAYATNNAGTGYGSRITLKTNNIPNFTPLKPVIPFPVNGAADISISTALSWSCTDPDNDPLTYDVYLDSRNPPALKVSSDQTGTAFPVTGLSNGIHYFWKVIAKDDQNNSTEGTVWSFTTENPTLVNTFGPDNSYLPGQGWTLGFSFSDFYVHAIGFKPSISGNVSRYKIAVFRNTEGARLDAMLLSDANDHPGTLLEKFSFNVPGGSNDLLISANSVTHPHLSAGTRYWLVVAPPENTRELFGWYRNPHISGVFNAQARSWDLNWITSGDAGYTPTLRIEGVAK